MNESLPLKNLHSAPKKVEDRRTLKERLSVLQGGDFTDHTDLLSEPVEPPVEEAQKDWSSVEDLVEVVTVPMAETWSEVLPLMAKIVGRISKMPELNNLDTSDEEYEYEIILRNLCIDFNKRRQEYKNKAGKNIGKRPRRKMRGLLRRYSGRIPPNIKQDWQTLQKSFGTEEL